jgi:hypothetical protein
MEDLDQAALDDVGTPDEDELDDLMIATDPMRVDLQAELEGRI